MPATPRHIVLCTCDQLRAFDVGCYDHPLVETPNLDRLAAEGVRFEHAISSNPVCMPARSCLLAGQYSRTCASLTNETDVAPMGMRRMTQYPHSGRPHLPDRTLPEALRDAGYRTAAIGKWHVHSWPDEVGFDRFEIPRNYHRNHDQFFLDHSRTERRVDGFAPDHELAVLDRTFADASEDEPQFVYFNISPPHMPLADIPDAYRTRYDPERVPLRANVPPPDELDAAEGSAWWYQVYRWDYQYYDEHRPFAWELPEGYGIRRLTAEYLGAVAWVDHIVGRMMETLRRRGVADDTLVLFLSDHGENLGSHGLFNKGQLYEESLRVPLIAHHPGSLEPRVVPTHAASLVDVAPTLIDLAGAEPVAAMQGRSLAPIVRGEAEEIGDNLAFVDAASGGIAVRDERYTVGLPWRDEPPHVADRPHMVFDRRADPDEMRNLADGSEPLPERVEWLVQRLQRWHAETPWLADRTA